MRPRTWPPNPAAPRTKINGTGPFTFVEHVKGSHVSGKKNDNYFKKGLPYLDGFKGIFTLQAAAMLNAVQGGQVLGEFRGISPAERDRLVAAMGDKIRDRGIELDAQSAGLLQRREEAVRRRARAQGAADGDRPLGRQPGPVAHLDVALGRRRGPSGLAVGDAGSRTGQAAGLLQGHQEVPRGGREAARGSGPGEPEVRAVEPQPRDALHAGRHLPGRPVAADRRQGRAQAVRHRRLSRDHEQRQLRRGDRLLQPVHGRLQPRPCQVPVAHPRAREPLALEGRGARQALTTMQLRERDSEKRKAHDPGVREAPVRAGLSAAAAVVAPHRADPQDADGLEDVAEPQPRPGARRRLAEHREPASLPSPRLLRGEGQRSERPVECSATPSTASC